MDIFFISVLIIIIVGLIYLLKKQLFLTERLLENVITYDEIIKNLDTIVEEIGKKLEIVDYKGSFSSDDEIGWFFTDIKKMFTILKDYKNID